MNKVKDRDALEERDAVQPEGALQLRSASERRPSGNSFSGMPGALEYIQYVFDREVADREAAANREKQKLLDEMRVLQEKAARVDELMVENKTLQAKCETQRKALDFANRQGGQYRKAFEKSKASHATDKAELKKRKIELEKHRIQRQKDKAAVHSWQAYFNHVDKSKEENREANKPLDDRQEVLDQHPEDSSSETLAAAPILIEQNASVHGSTHHQPMPDDPKASSNTDIRLENEVPTSISSASTNDGSKPSGVSIASQLIRSSQTTDDGFDKVNNNNIDEPQHVPSDAESDPILISSRVLKRKRSDDTKNIGKNTRAITVKDEPGSSPLSYTGISRLFDHNESMDLNDNATNLVTPRKNRYNPTLERSSSTPLRPSGRDYDSNAHLYLEKDLQNDHPTQRPIKSESPRPRSFAVKTENVNSNEQHVPSLLKSNPRFLDQPLQNIPVNLQSHPRTTAKKAKYSRRRDGFYGSFEELAVEGENNERLSKTVPPRPASHVNGHGFNCTGKRINSFLETTTPSKQPLVTRPATERPRQGQGRLSRSTIGNNSLRRSLHGPLQQNEANTGDPTSQVRPEEEPLRARPLHRLRLEDFKVNPDSNQGYDYAFAETVRNRDLRRCLPGCTRPECCGDRFKKMVELGGALAPVPRLWDSSQTDDEQRLLEEYMGADAGRLRTMGHGEKQDIVVRARAEQMAQRVGRHRQAFQRPRTPPGYWRTDFPSTQEVEADKARSRELERDKVAERYREAMRPNGRWMFRDE